MSVAVSNNSSISIRPEQANAVADEITTKYEEIFDGLSQMQTANTKAVSNYDWSWFGRSEFEDSMGVSYACVEKLTLDMLYLSNALKQIVLLFEEADEAGTEGGT